MINGLRAKAGQAPLTYLTELSLEQFRAEYEKVLPVEILGSEFLRQYQSHDDPVTKISPDATYCVAGPTRHPIGENERVLKFMDALRAARTGDEKALVTAGECMFGAHDSYKNNCHL